MRYRTDMSSVSRTTPPLTVGSMLRSAWIELIENVFDSLLDAGFDDLRPVHRPILRDLLTSNLRPSEFAARLGLSKQAANDLVREFEAKGYITLEPDPDDGRAKRIVATDRGWRASETAQEASNAVGRRWAELVGDERYAVFEEALSEIVAANRNSERTRDSPDHPDRPAPRTRPASRPARAS
jgi:DNA-binding MarR family transcriptional regulator